MSAVQPTLFERVLQLAQAVGGIDVDEDEPGLGGGELGQRPFRAVRRPDADPRRRARGRARESPPPARRRARRIPSRSSARLARRNQRLAIAPAPRRPDRGSARWCRRAAAHRRCRRRSCSMVSVKSVSPCVEGACYGIEASYPGRHCERSEAFSRHGAEEWIASSLALPCANASRLSPAMTVSGRCSLRRLLAGRIEPGIDAALEAREGFQRTCRPRTAAPASGSRR